LTGHSGRTIDPLFNDGFSDILLLFGKGRYKGHGYTKAKFTVNSDKFKVLTLTSYVLSLDDKNLVNEFEINIVQKPDFGITDREKIYKQLSFNNFNNDCVFKTLKSRKNQNDPTKWKVWKEEDFVVAVK